jgi:hypothetical protein
MTALMAVHQFGRTVRYEEELEFGHVCEFETPDGGNSAHDGSDRRG